jgi:hypothetical protein
MSVPFDALVAVAREFIRSEADRDVGISGDRFPKWPDAFTVLEVIEVLWADPHIDQVPYTESIEFAWNEKGFDQAPVTGLKAVLLGRFQIPPATVEEA